MMLILILINVQYLQSVFCIKKGSNGQNHSSSGSHHLIKKSPSKIFFMRSAKLRSWEMFLRQLFQTLKVFSQTFSGYVNPPNLELVPEGE